MDQLVPFQWHQPPGTRQPTFTTSFKGPCDNPKPETLNRGAQAGQGSLEQQATQRRDTPRLRPHGPRRAEGLCRTMEGSPSPWCGPVRLPAARKLCQKLPSTGTSSRPQTDQVTAPARAERARGEGKGQQRNPERRSTWSDLREHGGHPLRGSWDVAASGGWAPVQRCCSEGNRRHGADQWRTLGACRRSMC